jgi:hypothetical protein
MDKKENHLAYPQTAIFMGNGCSLNLGAPTSEGFLDAIIQRLLENTARSTDNIFDSAGIDWKDTKAFTDATACLKVLHKFLGEMRGAKLTLSSTMLNIEGLYRVAEAREPTDDPELLANLNKAIYLALRNIGDDFINNTNVTKLVSNPRAMQAVKSRSSSEDPSQTNTASKQTTLMAYLCLASYKEVGKFAPLFVQLNWDLALDRALWCLNETSKKQRGQFQWLNRSPQRDFKKTPLVIKPRGSINWHGGLISPKKTKNSAEATPTFKQESDGLRSLEEVTQAKPSSNLKWTEPYENLKQIYNVSQPLAIPEENTLSEDLKSLNAYIEATGLHSGPLMDFFGKNILVSPTIWKPENAVIKREAKTLIELLENVQRILIIGVDSALDDSNFTLLLAEALRKNSHAPKIYVWNPEVFIEGATRRKYLNLFAPVAREKRLFGIRGYFGDPALYDLDRVFHLGEEIVP